MFSSFLVTLAIVSLVLTIRVIASDTIKIYPYNEVNFIQYKSTEDFVNDVFVLYGEERSKTNVFLGVATPECEYILDSVAFRGAQRHAGGDTLLVATVPSEGFPLRMDSCAQVIMLVQTSFFNDVK